MLSYPLLLRLLPTALVLQTRYLSSRCHFLCRVRRLIVICLRWTALSPAAMKLSALGAHYCDGSNQTVAKGPTTMVLSDNTPASGGITGSEYVLVLNSRQSLPHVGFNHSLFSAAGEAEKTQTSSANDNEGEAGNIEAKAKYRIARCGRYGDSYCASNCVTCDGSGRVKKKSGCERYQYCQDCFDTCSCVTA